MSETIRNQRYGADCQTSRKEMTRVLKPFDLQALSIFLCIKVALVTDPCMGSGHILVYLFDVLMQIYESQGWTQREAAQSIVQNNLFGLDIDDRAAQLAYFAVMMKARQYDRRFLERGIVPHVYGIQESNGINREQVKLFGRNMSSLEKNNAVNQINELLDALTDAKEYGWRLTSNISPTPGLWTTYVLRRVFFPQMMKDSIVDEKIYDKLFFEFVKEL